MNNAKKLVGATLLMCMVMISVGSVAARIEDSLEKAQLEKKPVLIKFEASWCVWCEREK